MTGKFLSINSVHIFSILTVLIKAHSHNMVATQSQSETVSLWQLLHAQRHFVYYGCLPIHLQPCGLFPCRCQLLLGIFGDCVEKLILKNVTYCTEAFKWSPYG
ncbi:UNVERIFIED_CONTAM: hypothetical protein K2H54_035895 [Gekko kuhli]